MLLTLCVSKLGPTRMHTRMHVKLWKQGVGMVTRWAMAASAMSDCTVSSLALYVYNLQRHMLPYILGLQAGPARNLAQYACIILVGIASRPRSFLDATNQQWVYHYNIIFRHMHCHFLQ